MCGGGREWVERDSVLDVQKMGRTSCVRLVGGYFLFELAKSCDFRSILMMVMVDTVDDVVVRMLVS